MAAVHTSDQELLQKLLLGQLPTAEVERLATEYADDSRLAELAESVASKDDALLGLLQNHETDIVDPEGERLVERLLERLKPAIPVPPRDDTAAMNKADATTEPSSPDVVSKPQPLPERLEYYRPIKVLGQGGMGTVYLAEDTRLGREVAIKTLRPELAINPQAKERFLREARTAAKLEHDNVIPIYSVGEAADGTPFLAMPLLKGEPLDALIRRTSGPLPVATVVRIAREAASGLASAHERGLIHRDIKPANIWLEAPTGRVKILDFGLAKAADSGGEAESDTHLTASGAIVGTPAYMAPEQASGHPVDGRADLFSLGCVLYELLAGKRAFSGPNTMSILMSLANHTPPAPDVVSSECPAELSRLVMQLLEKDPAERPASAEAVIQALSELAIESVQASRAASAPGPSQDASGAVRGLMPSGSPTLVESDLPRPSDSYHTLPSTAVFPVRKRSIPKPRVALVLAGALLMLLAAVVYRIQTDKGTLVVEIIDDAVKATLKSNGLEVRDATSGRSFTIQAYGSRREASGDYKLVDGHGLKLVVLDEDGLELTTNEFKLVRDGKVRVRVTVETSVAASTTSPQTSSADPDRRAAEYVLSIGGAVDINGWREQRFKAVADLPQEPFRLTQVHLQHNPKVTDTALAAFRDCKNLEYLQLGNTSVSDAGLAHFQNCENLKALVLSHCPKLTDAGLRHFQGCKSLEDLRLSMTVIGDAGLANFQGCTNLTVLHIGDTRATDAGLAYFKNCHKLSQLQAGGKEVKGITDVGLAHFQNSSNWLSIELAGDQVTDAGLAHFKNCKNLVTLTLTRTQFSAAGLAVFKDCRSLDKLWLSECPQITDAGLAHFKDCSQLTSLSLRNTSTTDSGLAHFAACKNLGSLDIVGTKVTNAGLVHFADCTNLVVVGLDLTDITETGLEHFRASPNIENFGLSHSQMSDAGLARFQEWKKLRSLNLAGTNVTDAGLAHLQECKNLTLLHLQTTKVTPTGIDRLKQALPRCRIEWDGGVIEPSVSPDRRAAEWVLSIGGTIGIRAEGQEREIKAVGDLPRGAFELTVVGLPDNAHVRDDGLGHFQDCKNLTVLALDRTQVSDVGLAHFKDCKNLAKLGLGSTQVSDAGLAHFKDCKNLESLVLNETKVSDAGLAHFQDCKNLTALFLTRCNVSDRGLALFKDCKSLTHLSLNSTQVTDAGLINFKDCKNLRMLDLFNTEISDVSLNRLPNYPVLQSLQIIGTKVTEAGVKKLSAALPGCKIEWDGGVIEPSNATDSDRRAAEWVLSAGGWVRVDDQDSDIKVATDLPREPFRLTGFDLSECKRVTDEGLAVLKECKHLKSVNLVGTQLTDAGTVPLKDCPQLTELSLAQTKLTDAGLVHFQNCKNLTFLWLGDTQLTDVGLSYFQGCKNLTQLWLGGTQLTDAGLVHFKDCKDLTSLSLGYTKVTDAGLAHFQNCPKLTHVWLGKTQVTESGLANFRDCKNLTELYLTGTPTSDEGLADLAHFSKLSYIDLTKTKVTEAGVRKLSAALPGCKIEWDGGVIEPRMQ